MVFKKKLTIILLVLSSMLVHAQNELEFNQVINLKINGKGGVISKTVIIPKGKVWKATAAMAGKSHTSTAGVLRSNGTSIALTFDDVSLYYRGANSSHHYLPVFPYWFPEGTYTMKLFYGTLSSKIPIIGTVSVIEFNVK